MSHCFSLTKSDDAMVKGLSEVLTAYKTAIKNISLNGPTYFEDVLKHKLNKIKEKINEKIYHMILFLTDGSIHDMTETKWMVVEMSNYPVSIIIIGIGEADF